MARLQLNKEVIQNIARERIATFRSEADYSLDVHVQRPFMDAAVAETDILEVFQENFKGDIHAAFDATAEVLHENIKGQIQDEKWVWGNVTHRRNGQIVGSPRDIVDTGRLLESQTLEIQ